VVHGEDSRYSNNYGQRGKSAKLRQFPVTLGYAITNYKCQGLTFQWGIVDLKKPSDGSSHSTSPYVQLSRARNLNQVSIMRPFKAEELRTPHSVELVRELQRQERPRSTDRCFIQSNLDERIENRQLKMHVKKQIRYTLHSCPALTSLYHCDRKSLSNFSEYEQPLNI